MTIGIHADQDTKEANRKKLTGASANRQRKKKKKPSHGAFGKCKWEKSKERIRLANELIQKRKSGTIASSLSKVFGWKKDE